MGEGSSLGYSMLQASKVLSSPFIFHAADTIVLDKIPPPNKNWIGGYKGAGSSNYTSFNVLNGRIERIMEKGIIDPDYLHIGLVGINNYKDFWKVLNKLYKDNPKDQTLADVDPLNELLSQGTQFNIQEFKKWYDVGNVDALNSTRQAIGGSFYNLDKPEESIYLQGKSVIKFYSNPKLIKQKIKRAKVLKGLTPIIDKNTDNFFSYKYVQGDLYADVANPKNFKEFLHWCNKNLWTPTRETSDVDFKKICYDFYRNKSLSRAKDLLRKHSLRDEQSIINDEKIPSLKDIFQKIDFESLSDARQTNFHGDLILDNIIKHKKGYTLLDWRQSFGPLLVSGDLHYDLAKLNHNLTVNHKIVADNLFSVDVKGKGVNIDIHRREKLIECQRVLSQFIDDSGYDARKVKILTPLIWLSSSPLHHKPFDLFLFYFGKYNLWKIINEK
jgi:hypothetical protein